jgi:AhpD family alkylhydroperoxidase
VTGEGLPPELAALIDNDDKAAEAVLDYLMEKDGGIGLLTRVLSRRPNQFVPYLLYGFQAYEAPAHIDPKTAQLAAVAASAALMCDYCLIAHMRAAQSKGATLDEIMDVLLVAGAIAQSSTLAVAFRKFLQVEGKRDETQGTDF